MRPETADRDTGWLPVGYDDSITPGEQLVDPDRSTTPASPALRAILGRETSANCRTLCAKSSQEHASPSIRGRTYRPGPIGSVPAWLFWDWAVASERWCGRSGCWSGAGGGVCGICAAFGIRHLEPAFGYLLGASGIVVGLFCFAILI